MTWISDVKITSAGLRSAWPSLSSLPLTSSIEQILIGIANVECHLSPGRPFNYGNVTCRPASDGTCPGGCGKIGADVNGADLCYRDYPSAAAGMKDLTDTVINHRLPNGQKTRALGFLVQGDALGVARSMYEAGYYVGDLKRHPSETDRIAIYAQGILNSAQLIAPVLGQPLSVSMGGSLLPEIAGGAGLAGVAILGAATYWAFRKGVIRT
jgi:hypothetical protein